MTPPEEADAIYQRVMGSHPPPTSWNRILTIFGIRQRYEASEKQKDVILKRQAKKLGLKYPHFVRGHWREDKMITGYYRMSK